MSFLTYRFLKKPQAAALALFFMLATPAYAAISDVSVGTLLNATMEKNETLMDMAEKYQVGYAELLAANPNVDPWLPRKGTKVIIPKWHLLPNTVHKGLILNTGELRLYYFTPNGVKTFPIGIGREGLNTPQGKTTIINKIKGPQWRPTPRMRQEDPKLPEVVKSGPDNPMGAYALYLGWPSYRIHGTNKPKGIGRRASSGCIRMYANDIEWLFKNVPTGAGVTSITEPVKMGWIDGELYLEAEPNDSQIDELEYKNRQITIDIDDGVIARIRKFAGNDVGRIDWEKVRTMLIERDGIPAPVTVLPKGKKAYYPIRNATEKDEVALTPRHDVNPILANSKLLTKEEREAKKAEVVKATRRNDWDDLNGM